MNNMPNESSFVLIIDGLSNRVWPDIISTLGPLSKA